VQVHEADSQRPLVAQILPQFQDTDVLERSRRSSGKICRKRLRGSVVDEHDACGTPAGAEHGIQFGNQCVSDRPVIEHGNQDRQRQRRGRFGRASFRFDVVDWMHKRTAAQSPTAAVILAWEMRLPSAQRRRCATVLAEFS